MLATYFLPDLLSGFLTEHSGLTASVTQAGTTQIEEMLLRDDIELGVTTTSGTEDLERLPLIKEQMVVCVAENHPWAERSHLNTQELHNTPMVVYESGLLYSGTAGSIVPGGSGGAGVCACKVTSCLCW